MLPRALLTLFVVAAALALTSSRALAMLDADFTRRVVRENLPALRLCYLAGLERRPDLQGRVTARFTILPSGVVSAVELTVSTLDDELVEACLRERLRAMTFPVREGQGAVVVNYPFVFSP